MKKVIVSSARPKRNREDHIDKIAKLNSDLNKLVESLEQQRDYAHNGDSSGNILNIVHTLNRAQKDLSSYLKNCREAVNWW